MKNARRLTLEERNQQMIQTDRGYWRLSTHLFSPPMSLMGDINMVEALIGDVDMLEAENYTLFLDNVKTLEDLIQGLEELSPLADDALSVAERMAEKDFREFKEALLKERVPYCVMSEMPKRFVSLLLPRIFLLVLMADLPGKFGMPLGACAVRLFEYEEENKRGICCEV